MAQHHTAGVIISDLTVNVQRAFDLLAAPGVGVSFHSKTSDDQYVTVHITPALLEEAHRLYAEVTA